MPFKTVCIAIGAGQDNAVLDRAAKICELLEAHLVVLVIGVAPPPPTSPYGLVTSDIWASEIREGQDATQTRAAEVVETLKSLGVSASVETQYGDRATVATVAARAARYADLTLIFPQTQQFEQLQSWVMNGALFESGRPILIVPDVLVSFPQARRIMIAWDATIEASKAVRDSIELLQKADEVHAVLIDPVPSFDGHGPEPGADLATYLVRHNVATTVHRLPREGKDVAETLLRAAGDLDADLIVMGGFGHSRLRQRIFGGTTTSMMKDTKLPVLMAH